MASLSPAAFVSNHDTSINKPVKVKGAVGCEKRPPLLVVVGLGKGSEGPRETVGALWPLASLLASKSTICLFGSNWLIMLKGPKVDGADYCSSEEGCRLTWLRYQFYVVRVTAIILTMLVFLLEIGLPVLVKMSGPERKHWYNQYFVRGIVFIFLGILTQPDQENEWYASIIEGFSTFAYIYGLCLISVSPVNFLLSFIPRGYPTSVKTQRPESTFWAVVTLVSCGLCLLGFLTVIYQMFWYHDGQNWAQATYVFNVSMGDTSVYGKTLYVFQQYMLRICLAFFLPLLFAAELEVTPVLHGLPELRYLVTKGPMYLLIGTILLTADDAWPLVDTVNFIGYSFLCFGAAYLAFPAVRVVHELFGDRLSPKTRYYPGLYTFFSVWGVVMSILTLVMFVWQTIAYDDVAEWAFVDRYQWYALKVCGYVMSIIALCTELELEAFYEFTVGGVPIHFDFLRNWVSRALLYLFIACLIAEGGQKIDGDLTLFDMTRAIMWSWVAFSTVYVVFFLHLVSSAMLYKLYIANEAWFQKAIADESVSETTGLLNGDDDVEEGGRNSSAWSQTSGSNVVNRKSTPAKQTSSSSTVATNSVLPQDPSKKVETMKRFVLQEGGKLILSPVRFTEEKGGALGKIRSLQTSTSAAGAEGEVTGGGVGGEEEEGASQQEMQTEVKPQNFFVRGILYDEVGQSRRVDSVPPEKLKKGKTLPKMKKERERVLNGQAAFAAAQENKRIFCWSIQDQIPLVVSHEVSKMGKEAAIDVQVWCRAPVTSTWALAGAEDVQVGEARVALDQLSLGVPGVVQLHAPNSNASGASRGTLELTISYEPLVDEDDEEDDRQRVNDIAGNDGDTDDVSPRRGGGSDRKTKTSKSSSNLVNSATTADSYESAIDPASGRKYYFNRATGHRTWNKPVDNSKLSANDQTLSNAAL